MTNVSRTSRASATQGPSRAGEAQLKKAIDEVAKRNRAGKLGSRSVRFETVVGGKKKELKPAEAMKAYLAGTPVSATVVAFRNFTSGGKLTPTTRVIRAKVPSTDPRTFNTTGRGKEGPESFAKWIDAQLTPGATGGGSSGRTRHPTKR